MKRKIWTSLVLGLSVVVAVPSFAQQRAQSARRQQTKANSSATANQASNQTAGAADSAMKSAPAGNASEEGAPAPNAFGAPPTPNGAGERRAPRMGGFALIGVQMRTYQEVKGEDEKVAIDAFLTAFMKAAKAADTNSDGKLSQEELQALQSSFAPNGGGFNGGGFNGRRAPRGENGEGAPANGRRQRQNSTQSYGDSSYGDSTFNAVVRAQQGEGGASRRSPQGFPGQFGQGGSRSVPGMTKAINEATNEEDGAIDLTKLETALKNALTEADSDKDGSLDNSEWGAYSGFGGAPGFGGMPGGFDPRAGARMRAMAVGMLQRQVQEKAQTEDGKIDVAKFRSEYVGLLKEADSDGDGKLNEEELQALQEKATEAMRQSFGGNQPGGFGGGFGGPQPGGFGGGFGGARQGGFGGNPFDAFKNEDGKVDLSKVPESPFTQGLKDADKDADGFLDEDELNALQEQMRSMMRQGGRNGGFDGSNEGRPGRRGRNDVDAGSDGFGLLYNSDVIIRAQEGETRGGNFGGDGADRGQGRQRGGMPGGAPGMRGGMPGGMGPGFGMGMGFRGNSGAVQKAISKAIQEDGTFVIATFDEELAKALNNSDNEDDGMLDQIEQEDAFGMAIGGRGFNPGANRGGSRAGREGVEGRPGGNEQGRRSNDRQAQQRPNERQMNDRFQAMRVPTPSDSFVGVVANPDFKFSKARKEGGAAEKSPIEADYAIGKYEVRNREYKEFVDATKRETFPKYWVDGTYVKGTKNCPVVGITLKDAQDYCDWLTSQNEEGWTFRLPTEAEFENAAAGSKKQRFPWGTASEITYLKGVLTTNCLYNGAVLADLIEQDASVTVGGKKQKVADFAKLSNKGVVGEEGWRDTAKKVGFTYSDLFAAKVKQGGFVAPVNKYRENESPYGCVGMAGNAAEWTTSVVDGKNVARGGSWYSTIDECAATARGELKDPAKGDPTVGFRVVAERN